LNRKNKYAAVVLAGGKGTRLGDGISKPARLIKGKSIVRWIIEAQKNAGVDKVIVVVRPVGLGGKEVMDAAGDDVEFAIQKEANGTGDAARSAWTNLDGFDGNVLITVGDAPAFNKTLINEFIDFHEESGADLSFATAIYDPVPPYGRVWRTSKDGILGIIDDSEATASDKEIKEVITSQYLVKSLVLKELLAGLEPSIVTGEINLTDIVNIAVHRRFKVKDWLCNSPEKLMGVNTPEDFVEMENMLSDNQ